MLMNRAVSCAWEGCPSVETLVTTSGTAKLVGVGKITVALGEGMLVAVGANVAVSLAVAVTVSVAVSVDAVVEVDVTVALRGVVVGAG